MFNEYLLDYSRAPKTQANYFIKQRFASNTGQKLTLTDHLRGGYAGIQYSALLRDFQFGFEDTFSLHLLTLENTTLLYCPSLCNLLLSCIHFKGRSHLRTFSTQHAARHLDFYILSPLLLSWKFLCHLLLCGFCLLIKLQQTYHTSSITISNQTPQILMCSIYKMSLSTYFSQLEVTLSLTCPLLSPLPTPTLSHLNHDNGIPLVLPLSNHLRQ